MVLRMKNFNILGVRSKIQLLGVGFTKNQNRRKNFLKRRPWTVGQFKGGQARKSRAVFLRGRGLISQSTLFFFQPKICPFPLPHKEKNPKISLVSLLPLNSSIHVVTQQKLHVQLQLLLLCYFCFTFILSVLNCCPIFTECCLQLSNGFKWSKSVLARFAPFGKKIVFSDNVE